MTEAEQINELLAEANAHGVQLEVIDLAKAISDKTQCTALSAFQWAYKLCVLDNA